MTRQNDKFIFYWETDKNPITGWRVPSETEIYNLLEQQKKNKHKNK